MTEVLREDGVYLWAPGHDSDNAAGPEGPRPCSNLTQQAQTTAAAEADCRAETRRVSQMSAISNQTWAWLREMDRLRRTPVEEGGFGSAAAF